MDYLTQCYPPILQKETIFLRNVCIILEQRYFEPFHMTET